MTLARILQPHKSPDGQWHVPAEISLPGGASVHLIVSAPEHAISAALQLASARLGQAISQGAAVTTPRGFVGYDHDGADGALAPFYRRRLLHPAGPEELTEMDEVAGWWSDLGRKIGKAVSGSVGRRIVKGVVSYIPYVGPAIAQSGLVDMAVDAGGAAAAKAERKSQGKRSRRAGRGPRRGPRSTRRTDRPRRARTDRPRRARTSRVPSRNQRAAPRTQRQADQREEAIRRIKREGGLHFDVSGVPRRTPSNAHVSHVNQFRALLKNEHGSKGAKHVMRLAKAVALLKRASTGDRKAMATIDRTAQRAAAGDPRAQVAAGYIGALVQSSNPLAAILKDLGSRRAGYRPAIRES